MNRLYSVFGLNLYGIELFNFNHKYISDLYMSWRKVIRRIFIVPYRTHNDIVKLYILMYVIVKHWIVNIQCFVQVYMAWWYIHDGITHTARELCELRDHVNTCKLDSPNMIHVLLTDGWIMYRVIISVFKRLLNLPWDIP